MKHEDMHKIPSKIPRKVDKADRARANRSIRRTLENARKKFRVIPLLKAPESRTDQNGKAKRNHIRPHNLFKTSTNLKTLCIILMFLISVTLHLAGIQSLYFIAKADKAKPKVKIQQEKPAFKIQPVKIHQEIPKIAKKSSPPPGKTERTATKKRRPKKRKRKENVKPLSEKALAALGRRYLPMLGKDMFPALSLSYDNPATYIREMYRLGAMTVVLNQETQDCSRINLFSGDISPLTRSDFAGFSDLKRVIKDSIWEKNLQRAAARLGTTRPMLSLLLVVPMSLETQWIGHQVHLLQSMHLDISHVASVDALFRKSKLIIRRVHLADGSARDVIDHSGV